MIELEKTFLNLVSQVKRCNACPRMCSSSRVLSMASGPLSAEIMFIGEAPGRKGADQTEIPFHGDVAGDNFEDFIKFAGLHRGEVFVTNAVLCNPKDENGNNSTPTISEITNCSAFLKKQIHLINPKLVVTLGTSSLNALQQIERHEIKLSRDVRSSHDWYGRKLIPLYHPGQRAIIHRSKANQRSDYQFVAETYRSLKGARRKVSGATADNIMSICKYMLSKKAEFTYFELHKYFYLLEYLYSTEVGKRLTNAHFIRQKDGPYCTDLHINKIRKADASIKLSKEDGKLKLQAPQIGRDMFSLHNLNFELISYVDRVFDRYQYESEGDLKKAVYLTAPMRMILRKERSLSKNFYNTPIEFISN